MSGLAPGWYNYSILAADGYGAQATYTAWVTVDDAVQVSHPANVTFPAGTTNHTISWTLVDTIGAGNASQAWVITWQPSNGTSIYGIARGKWNSGPAIPPITVDVSFLAPGQYVVAITASDGLGSTASDNVTVLVTQPNLMAMVRGELAYLNATAPSSWKNNDTCHKAAILEALQDVEGKLAAGNYAGAYDLLNTTVVPDLQAWVVNATLKAQCSQWVDATLEAIFAQIPASSVAAQLEAAIGQLAAAIQQAENATLGCQGKEVVRELEAAQAALDRSLTAYLAASARDAKTFARAAKDCVCSADSIADAFHGHTSVDKAWEALDAALDSDAANLSAILRIFTVD